MNSHQTFEARFERALRTYGEQAVLPFDPDAIAEQAMGPETTPRSRFGAMLVPILLVVVLLVALAAAIATLVTPDPTPVPRPSHEADVTGGVLSNGAGQGHATVRLEDGRLLVVSGTWRSIGGGPTSTAELWDPATGAATGTAAELVTDRANASATLLADGRVLVVGGFGGPYAYASSSIASAEVWDPATGTFSETGSLAYARVGHTASLLDDGRVLVVGGSGPDGMPPVAEVYDPAAGTFEPAGEPIVPRAGHTATVLADGRVLVVGGRDADDSGGPTTLTTTELWDPATGSFSAAGELVEPRQSHTATLLEDGRVLVVGGYIGAGYGTGSIGIRSEVLELDPDLGRQHLSSAELWDPGTEAFTLTGSLGTGRARHTATLLDDGRVAVIGGVQIEESGGRVFVVITSSVEVWDAAAGAFSAATDLEEPRESHTAVAVEGVGVLVVGGSGATMDLTSVEVWRP
jgi:hypothetical protein